MASPKDAIVVEPAISLSGVRDTPNTADEWLHDEPRRPPASPHNSDEESSDFPSSGSALPIRRNPRQGETVPNSNFAGDQSTEVAQAPPTHAATPLQRKRAASAKELENEQRRKKATATILNTEGGGHKLKRVVYTAESTAQIMLWFQECRAQGLFHSSKRKDYGAAWEFVLDRCKQTWPNMPWTGKTIPIKYDTERNRYRVWQQLLEYSGVSYNEVTGLPEASESVWESFFLRHQTKQNPLTWLRNTPLGDRDVYANVFWRERATGSHIIEAQELPTQPNGSEETDDEDSNHDNSDPLDLDSSNNERDGDGTGEPNRKARKSRQRTTATPAGTQAPAKRLTRAQQHRLDTDPDTSPSRRSVSIASEAAISVPKAARRTKESEGALLASSMREAAAMISTPRHPGAGDLAKAVEDLERLFTNKISADEMVNCALYLQKNPLAAGMWHGMSSTMKKLMVDRWKVGNLDS